MLNKYGIPIKLFDLTDHLSLEEKESLFYALLDAVWIMRWTENKQAMYSVLHVREAEKMTADILEELDKAGYKIVKK